MTLQEAEKMQNVAINNMTDSSLIVDAINKGRKVLVKDFLADGVTDDDIIIDNESFNVAHLIFDELMNARSRFEGEAIVKRYVLALLMMARKEI